jgi:hypothetical protein
MAKETLSFVKSKKEEKNAVIPDSVIKLLGRGPATKLTKTLSKYNGKVVDWVKDAKPMIEEHLGSPNPITAINNSGDREALKGLRVDKTLVKLFVDNAAIKEVFIMPAVRTVVVDEVETKVLTTILVGIDNNDFVQTNFAIEFCSPCPEDCPVNMQNGLP